MVHFEDDRVVVVRRRRSLAVRLALALGRGGRSRVARNLVPARRECHVRGHGGRKRRRALGIVGRDEVEQLALDVVRRRVLALQLLVIADFEELLQAPTRKVQLSSAASPLGITLMDRSR